MAKNHILDIILGVKDKATGPLKKIEQFFSASMQRIKKVLTGLAIGAAALLTTAFIGLTKSVKAFAQQELGEYDMESALRAMGTYTDEYKEKLITLANQYQKTTNIGDETWLKTFGLLTRFGMSAENVDKVTEATKNLAALMDGNLEGAALAMQRALEGEFSMFSRYGIKLDLTGDAKKDLENLFDNLETKGAGLLEARAETLSGKWQALKNSISDFQEEVGRVITDATGLKGGLAEVAEWFDTLQESAKNGTLHDLLTSAGDRVHNFAISIKEIVEQINSIEDLQHVFGKLGEFIYLKLKEGAAEAGNILMEVAPKIGAKIAEAMVNYVAAEKEGERRASQKLYGKDEPDFFSKAAWGLDPEYRQESRRQMADVASENTQVDQIKIDPVSWEDFENTMLDTMPSRNDGVSIQDILAAGPNMDELAEMVESWKLTQAEFNQVSDYIDAASDSAVGISESAEKYTESAVKANEAVTKSAEAAAKAGDAATESSVIIKDAMDRSKDASMSAAQAAKDNIALTEQVIALNMSLVGTVAIMRGDLSDLRGQVDSMRV